MDLFFLHVGSVSFFLRIGPLGRFGLVVVVVEQKKMLLAPFLTPAETKISVLLSALVKRFGVSRMRDFLIIYQV